MKIIILILLFCFSLQTSAQIMNPVHWNFSVQKVSPKNYEIHLTSTIDRHWHIYSQLNPKDGAVPTKVTFEENPIVAFKGPVKEIGTIVSKYEEVFGITVKYYEEKVDFIQLVTLKTDTKTFIKGSILFMACKENQCFPPEEAEFNLELK